VGLSEAHKPKIRSFSILDLRPQDVLKQTDSDRRVHHHIFFNKMPTKRSKYTMAKISHIRIRGWITITLLIFTSFMSSKITTRIAQQNS